MDRGFGTPEVVVVLVEECSDRAVAERHVDQGKSPCVLGQRMLPLLRDDLPCGLIEYLGWRGGRVVEHDISPILWPLHAVGARAPYRLHLVVRLRLLVAVKRWRRTEEKLTCTGDTERGYVLPLKKDSDCDSIHDWTTRRSLIVARNGRPGYLGLRGRRAVVRTKSDHGQSCGVARRYAVILGLTVRYRSQRVCASGVEGGRAGREISTEHPIGSLDGCCVS